ncbi:MAG: flagellar basal body P-ring protein FlgI [Methylococcales bacterium]|nr:flagellar basal body P-ring protein FlgI [Methylococcales bacterium]
MKRIITLFFLLFFFNQPAYSKGLGNLSSAIGVRGNPLAGYGLVIGLNNANNKAKFNRRNIRKLLIRLSRAFPKKIDRRSRYTKAFKNKEARTNKTRFYQTKKLVISSIDETEQLLDGALR